MLSIFYPGLEIKLKHTWPCSKFAYAYKKKACTEINRVRDTNVNSWVLSQPAITCSKLTTETLEQGVKYVQS